MIFTSCAPSVTLATLVALTCFGSEPISLGGPKEEECRG